MTTIMNHSWNFVGPGTAAWVDPPHFGELQAAPYFGKIRDALREKLDGYHRLPKQSADHLAERAQQLSNLAAWLTESSDDLRLKDWTASLQGLAAAKAVHLTGLLQVFRENWHLPERLFDHHMATCGEEDQRFRPIFLTNQRYFWPQLGLHWGDYWMETLDPCHRHLPHMHAWWQRLSGSGESLPHYLLWLEENHAVTHKAWMRFFTPLEQAETRLLVEQGRLTNVRGRALNCTDSQHFFFVIDLAKTLFATRAQPHLCHSSFTRGRPVFASGGLQAREGRLTHLKFESGHYLAGPAEWWQALQILLELGIDFSEGVRITVFDRFRYISRVMTADSLLSAESLRKGLGLSPDEWAPVGCCD